MLIDFIFKFNKCKQHLSGCWDWQGPIQNFHHPVEKGVQSILEKRRSPAPGPFVLSDLHNDPSLSKLLLLAFQNKVRVAVFKLENCK